MEESNPALRTAHVAMAWSLTAFAMVLGACSEADDGPRPAGPGSSAVTSGSGGGQTGSGGDGGAGGGATASSSTSGVGGAGAGGAGAGGAGAGGGELLPADEACLGERAFRATGMSFAPPTPKALALALTELVYEYETSPVTVVLRAPDPQSATLATSATEVDDLLTHQFPEATAPSFTAALVHAGSFHSGTPQATGYLRVTHLAGVADVELSNLSLSAASQGGCATLVATLDAVIPATQRSISVELSAGATTLGDLAGGASGDGVQLRALFVAESVAFDFEGLDAL